MMNWLQGAITQISNLSRHSDAPISTEEFVKRTIQIREITTSTMNKPKPLPPKEEKKEEPKPEASQQEPHKEDKKPEDMELD